MGMDPISMAVMGVTTGVKLFGAHQANKAQQQAASYNNKLAQAEALNHMKENAEATKRKRKNNEAEIGAMKTRLAATGFESDTGTELDLVTEAAGRMELEIQDQGRSAQMRANSMRAKGKMGLWEAKTKSRATSIGMFNTVASGYAGGLNMTRTNKFHGLT
jgi:hypothetical protein